MSRSVWCPEHHELLERSGSGGGVGRGKLGQGRCEAPSADSVLDVPNAVVGPAFKLSANNGRQK